MKNKSTKIQKFANTTRNVVRGLRIISFITIFICAVSIMAALFKPSFSFNIPMLSNELLNQTSVGIDVITRYFAIWYMVVYILYALFAIIILKPFSKIILTVAEKNPFDVNNSKQISHIGWTLIIGINLISIVQYIIGMIVFKMLNLSNFSARINWAVILLSVFVGLLILILAQIFKYGSYLQSEYDSTL